MKASEPRRFLMSPKQAGFIIPARREFANEEEEEQKSAEQMSATPPSSWASFYSVRRGLDRRLSLPVSRGRRSQDNTAGTRIRSAASAGSLRPAPPAGRRSAAPSRPGNRLRPLAAVDRKSHDRKQRESRILRQTLVPHQEFHFPPQLLLIKY